MIESVESLRIERFVKVSAKKLVRSNGSIRIWNHDGFESEAFQNPLQRRVNKIKID